MPLHLISLSTDLLRCRECHALPPDEFKRMFLAAADGEENCLSKQMKIRRLKDRLPRDIWSRIRAKVFSRDGFKCRYCEAEDSPLHCDHVVPLSRGGSNDLENLATACRSCNLSKSAKTPEEWLR